jgi:hypothetical protein
LQKIGIHISLGVLRGCVLWMVLREGGLMIILRRRHCPFAAGWISEYLSSDEIKQVGLWWRDAERLRLQRASATFTLQQSWSYARNAQLPNVTPHALRHTFCVNPCATPLNPFLIASYAGFTDVRALRPYYDRLSTDLSISASMATGALRPEPISESLRADPNDLRDFFRRRSTPDHLEAQKERPGRETAPKG